MKAKPNNPDLKARTLALGRAYANLARNRQGVLLLDEVTLMNDINAACAGAGVTDLRARLERLEGLRAAGLVTEEEYQQTRAQILREL